jgi:hypothetical protein
MNGDHPELPEKSNKPALDILARRIAWLFYVYILETISEEEHDELDDWVCASMKNQKLFEELTDPVFTKKLKGANHKDAMQKYANQNDSFQKDSLQMINDFLNPN